MAEFALRYLPPADVFIADVENVDDAVEELQALFPGVKITGAKGPGETEFRPLAGNCGCCGKLLGDDVVYRNQGDGPDLKLCGPCGRKTAY